MTLDLAKVVAQVAEMVAGLRDRRQDRAERLRHALETLGGTGDIEALREKIRKSRTTWLVADILEKPDARHAAPSLPPDFTVLATDGSHIDIDRHRSARCYLINTGGVTLRYGAAPDARLESQPRLYARDEDFAIAPPGGKGREQPVDSALLGIKRGIEECRRLAGLVREQPGEDPVLALLDGTLIQWGLEAYPDFVGDVLLHQGLLASMEEMRQLGQRKKVALASYISLPRSADVVNALRVALCPQEVVNSDRCCPDCQTRECDALAALQDRELFASVLDPGERSALFASRSSVVEKRYGEHAVHFFYLRLEDEVARIEVPQWVSQDSDLLGLAHCLVLDQCRRGQGYPVALSEAHEQAIVTRADREDFWQLVETSLVAERLPSVSSAKSFSKRTRWV
ncbi:MAG: DNA double-strand break repair nuclease NurA [Chloroflexi bacterium]|nr:DNA double-strand break repair nuclease NurA [Chloroflexota bacterium]